MPDKESRSPVAADLSDAVENSRPFVLLSSFVILERMTAIVNEVDSGCVKFWSAW